MKYLPYLTNLSRSKVEQRQPLEMQPEAALFWPRALELPQSGVLQEFTTGSDIQAGCTVHEREGIGISN